MTEPQRPSPSPLSVSEPWDLVSSGYAAEAEAMMLPFTRDAIALARPAPEARVLDVATGPGVLALELAPHVKRVDALDFSPAMLNEFEAKRKTLGIDNAFAQRGDGQALPFEAGSFDAAFSMFGLMFFPDRPKGFAELFRVLRPGGVAVVSSWAPVDRSPLMILFIGALRAADATRPAPQYNALSLENPELFRKELEAAGFEQIAIGAYEHGVSVASPEHYWQVISRAAAPLAVLKKRLGPDEWQRQAALAEGYVREHIREPQTLRTTAYLAVARRPVGS
jgi:ubiquinone/menaquinone biosynthesis C-methylase UbiE